MRPADTASMTAREPRTTVPASEPRRREPGDAPIDGQVDGQCQGQDDVRDDGQADAPGGPRATRPKEIGGPAGPEPTRYGDWERGGRCSDF